MMDWKKVLLVASIVLLLTNSADASVNWVKKSYFQNWGGLNDNLSSTEIQDNEATDIQNVIFDTGGAIKKRFGYLTLPNNPALSTNKVTTGAVVSINGLAYYTKNNGNKFIVAVANSDGKATVMEKPYSSGFNYSTPWVLVDSPTPSSGYVNDDICNFIIAQDWLVFTVGIRAPPYVWKGTGVATALTTDANVPSGTLLAYYKNQLFVSGDSTTPSRVWFSNLGDITTWTFTDFFDIDNSDGTQVRGIIPAFDCLYIFKDKSIWRLSGYERDSFRLDKMVDGIGTLSPNSLKIVNNFIYFTTAQNDIAVYDGAYTVKFVSQKIRNTIGGLNFSRATQTTGLAFSTYKYNDFDYYASVSSFGSSKNDTVLLFDTAFNAWTKFKGINANAWCVGQDNNSQNMILFGDTNGYVYTYPSTTYYDGNVVTSAIVAFYQTKWFKYDEIALGDKYWRLLKTFTLAEPSTTTLSAELKVDQESSGRIVNLSLNPTSSLWDMAVWDVDVWSGSNILINRTEVERGTQMFQIKYSNSDVNKGFTISGYQNFIEPTDRI